MQDGGSNSQFLLPFFALNRRKRANSGRFRCWWSGDSSAGEFMKQAKQCQSSAEEFPFKAAKLDKK